ncbi:hypothetical protein AGLY_006205 [Aphis glycines]|uniref:Uncharacterized protein n=1 Tax=Aphis glycines TaxID=307491 RepID=A0A6G0TQY6_APHGL|nr:hypothetical protein AGLY_006205 [Aphis glycines]
MTTFYKEIRVNNTTQYNYIFTSANYIIFRIKITTNLIPLCNRLNESFETIKTIKRYLLVFKTTNCRTFCTLPLSADRVTKPKDRNNLTNTIHFISRIDHHSLNGVSSLLYDICFEYKSLGVFRFCISKTLYRITDDASVLVWSLVFESVLSQTYMAGHFGLIVLYSKDASNLTTLNFGRLKRLGAPGFVTCIYLKKMMTVKFNKLILIVIKK